MRRRPQITWMSARLPMIAVNIEVRMPMHSVTAKPRTGPVPKVKSTMPAISVVMLESAMAENALSNPALIAA